MAKLLLLVVGIAALAAAQAQQLQQLQRLISEEQSKCASGQDSMACIKERAMRFVDNVLSKDSYTVSSSSSDEDAYLIPSVLETVVQHGGALEWPTGGACERGTRQQRRRLPGVDRELYART